MEGSNKVQSFKIIRPNEHIFASLQILQSFHLLTYDAPP
jgi:hypothetical protein